MYVSTILDCCLRGKENGTLSGLLSCRVNVYNRHCDVLRVDLVRPVCVRGWKKRLCKRPFTSTQATPTPIDSDGMDGGMGFMMVWEVYTLLSGARVGQSSGWCARDGASAEG